MSDPIRTALGADGVLVASIDMADRTMNVFSAELMDALDTLMDRVDSDPAVHSCIITSGKASFLAGADLTMVRGFCDAARPARGGDAAPAATHEQMFAACGRLGKPCGIVGPTPEMVARFLEYGYSWVAIGSDMSLMVGRAQEYLGKLRGITAAAPAAQSSY